jgi:putative DNA primase/helicase
MADFATFGEAVGRSLHWPAGTFLADYDDNRREATVTQLEDSMVADVLVRNAYRLDGWSGTASELLSLITQGVSKKVATSSRWAKSPGWLTNEQRRIGPLLRMHGLSINSERNRDRRLIMIMIMNTNASEIEPR